jgi:cold shock CspA family protein
METRGRSDQQTIQFVSLANPAASCGLFDSTQGVLNVNGTCKWFHKDRGYGFLDTPDGDLFVHASGIQFGMQLAEGTRFNSMLNRTRKADGTKPSM